MVSASSSTLWEKGLDMYHNEDILKAERKCVLVYVCVDPIYSSGKGKAEYKQSTGSSKVRGTGEGH